MRSHHTTFTSKISDRQLFPSADLVKNFTVFNIGGEILNGKLT